MARWEPDARERLVRAALDLFAEQGYDDTTVVQIAERAGLTKSTFFRHFPDKREVLAAGQDALSQLLSDGIAAAPRSATPLEMVAAALDAAAGAFIPERRDLYGRARNDHHLIVDRRNRSLYSLWVLGSWLPTPPHNTGASVRQYSWAFACLHGGSVVAFVAIGRIMDKVNPFRVLIVSFLLGAVSLVVFG